MSALHVVYTLAGLDAARNRLNNGDIVLLAGDAVYATDIDPNYRVLEEDLEIRGAHSVAHAVNYTDFVRLTEQHSPVVSWP